MNEDDFQQQQCLNHQGPNFQPNNFANAEQIDKKLVKCVRARRAQLFCLNKKCKQQWPFACNDFKCKCNIMHKKCQTGKINMALQIIKQKLDNTQTLKQFADQVIENEITKLRNLKQNLNEIIEKRGKFINLSQKQTQFYNLFTDSNQEPLKLPVTKSDQYCETKFQKDFDAQEIGTFTTENLVQLWQILGKDKAKQTYVVEMIQNQLKYFSTKIGRCVISLMEATKQILKTKTEQNQIIKVNQLSIKNSSIINTTQQLQNLISFFDKEIKSLRIIYKASNNKFRISKFHQVGGTEKDIILICRNQNDKIIGCFTPLNLYHGLIFNGFVDDRYGSTFIFSLNTNQKFIQKNRTKSLYCMGRSDTINFGYCFAVCDSANISNGSILRFQNQYFDTLHYKNDKESYLKITGNQTCNFKIKEWEVLKVQFT